MGRSWKQREVAGKPSLMGQEEEEKQREELEKEYPEREEKIISWNLGKNNVSRLLIFQ